MNMFGIKLQDGNKYLNSWPKRKELNSLFPENRVISATQLGKNVMPALAVLGLMLQYQFGEPLYWPTTIALTLFMVSLPMQGLYWLGNRATSHLPPSMANWYRDLHEKMQQEGCKTNPLVHRPKYQDLAYLLRSAFKQLDKTFLTDV